MIKLIKLVTGEEVLSEVEQVGDSFVFKNPVKLGLTQQGVAMIPLSPFAKEDVKITVNKVNVVYETDPDSDVTNAYNERFGGILLAKSNLSV